jgi:drug/metabolite transporter (DMT)-like permease
VVLLWGVNFAAIKVALAEINPLAFAVLRFALASTVLVALVRLSGGSLAVPRADWPIVLLLGLVGHTVYQLLFTLGLARTSSGHSALILALVPVFVAVIGTALGIDRLRWLGWAGVALSFAGLVILVGGSGELDGPSRSGDLLTLGAALAWSLYTVLGRPVLERHSPLKLTAVTMVVGTVGLAVAGAGAVRAQDWGAVSYRTWALTVYATLGGLVVAYVIWYAGVQRLGGARTAVYSNLVPVVALFVSLAALGERLAPVQLAGAIVVVTGVWLTRRGRTAG